VLEQRYWFRRSDIILLSVSFLLALTFWDFYWQPADVKLVAIKASLADRAFYLEENEGILPPGVSVMFRSVFGISLAIAQSILLYRWYTQTRPNLPNNEQNRSIFRWLVFFTSAIAFTFIITTIQYFFQFLREEDFYWITSSTVMITVLVALIYLLVRPNILYGLHGWTLSPLHPKVEAMELGDKVTIQRLMQGKHPSEEVREKVETYMHVQKPFIRQGYTIAHLSSELNIPLHQLSSFINQQMGQSFNEFINSYRIKYLQEMLLKDSIADQYTLEALGKKAGFNSRSTFIAAVKKQTGQTPSSYFSRKITTTDDQPDH
jgi:AraC-like DNA-binding protein/membrane protein YdbS with pleckstrin-like domain